MNTWKQDTPSAMAMTITPEIAAAMLATSSGNRKMRHAYVDRLAGAMTRGEWRVTSQGIGFDTAGALRDGHHRLSACIRSGVPIRSMVVLGMPVTAYQVIDTGVVRTYADRLDVPRKVAEVLNFAAVIMEHGYDTKPVTAAQILPLFQTPLLELAQAFGDGVANRSYVSSTPMRLAGCISIMQGQRKTWVLQQFHALCALDFDSMTPISQALVRQLQKSYKGGSINTSKIRFDALARGLRVFDESRCDATRLQIFSETVSDTVQSARETLRRAVAESATQTTFNLTTP